MYRRQTKTLYVRWGDWLTPVLLVLAGIGWFVGNRKQKKINNQKTSDVDRLTKV